LLADVGRGLAVGGEERGRGRIAGDDVGEDEFVTAEVGLSRCGGHRRSWIIRLIVRLETLGKGVEGGGLVPPPDGGCFFFGRRASSRFIAASPYFPSRVYSRMRRSVKGFDEPEGRAGERRPREWRGWMKRDMGKGGKKGAATGSAGCSVSGSRLMIFRVDLTFASLGARRYSDGAEAVESFKLLLAAFHFSSQINTLVRSLTLAHLKRGL